MSESVSVSLVTEYRTHAGSISWGIMMQDATHATEMQALHRTRALG